MFFKHAFHDEKKSFLNKWINKVNKVLPYLTLIHEIWCGLFPTFGLLQANTFNFTRGTVLSSDKSHANTIMLQVEPSQCVSIAGIRLRACHWWLRQSLKPNTIWCTGQPPLIYLSIFIQRVLGILNPQPAWASLGVLYAHLQWYLRPHTILPCMTHSNGNKYKPISRKSTCNKWDSYKTYLMRTITASQGSNLFFRVLPGEGIQKASLYE